jgi:hypothetical protein
MDDQRAHTHRPVWAACATGRAALLTQLRRRPPTHLHTLPVSKLAREGAGRSLARGCAECDVDHSGASPYGCFQGGSGGVSCFSQRRRVRLCVSCADGSGRAGPTPSIFHDTGTRRDFATTCGASGTIDAGNRRAMGRIERHKALSHMDLNRHDTPRFFLLPGLLPGSASVWRGLTSNSSVVATR